MDGMRNEEIRDEGIHIAGMVADEDEGRFHDIEDFASDGPGIVCPRYVSPYGIPENPC
jgi:hypothetical protein